ncbi:MAG: disulfide bond formation protein B [Proteobacteria bacterium]|nr:disulfide bond formation protein B [Pseudomonadota bacterium]
MTPRSLTRTGLALGAAACAALLGYGFYLQYFDGQDPCPLCLVQRGFYFGLLFVFLAAAIHGPARVGGMVYGVLGLLLAAGGAGTAGRQVWLQHLPPDQVPKCGPDLYYMLDHFPFAKVVTNLFKGSGQCAEVTWRAFGLSIAEWSLGFFVVFAILALWAMLRQR